MNIFKFDEFIVPKILTVLYDIILVSSIGVGLFRVFTGISDAIETNNFESQFSTILAGLGIAVIIPLVFRIMAELALILFKIEANTRSKK